MDRSVVTRKGTRLSAEHAGCRWRKTGVACTTASDTVAAVPSAEFPCTRGETGEPRPPRPGGESPSGARRSGWAASPSANSVRRRGTECDEEDLLGYHHPGLAAYLVLPLPGLSAPLSAADRQQARAARQEEGAARACSPPRSRATTNRIDALQGEITATADAARTRPGEPRRAEAPSCSRCATGSRRRATGSSGCATSWPRRGGCSPPGWWRSTRPTAPDALTVVLEADGFGDLLERAEFLERISDQDREITDARARAARQGGGAGRPAGRARAARAARRGARSSASANEIAAVQDQLLSSRNQLASARDDRRGALAQVRSQPRPARGRPRRARGRAGARGRRAQRRAGRPGPIKQGSGQLIWPVNGPVVSGVRDALGPPARGRRHRGARAARRSAPPTRGTVVLMGWVGGYGNYTCIQHTAQPVHVLRPPVELRAPRTAPTCSQGQVIGYGRLHRPLLRRPPALRDAHQRVAGGPDGLPLDARAPTAPGSGRAA